jgi:hypothetical protein
MADRTLFSSDSLSDYLERKRIEASRAVEMVTPSGLQNQPEDDLIKNIVTLHSVAVPVIRKADIKAYEPSEVQGVEMQFGERVTVGRVEVEFAVPYDGDGRLFGLKPDTHRMKFPAGQIVAGSLILKVTHATLDAAAMRVDFDAQLALVESFLDNVTEQVAAFNRQLPEHVTTKLKQRRESFEAQRQFADGIGFPVVKRDQ